MKVFEAYQYYGSMEEVDRVDVIMMIWVVKNRNWLVDSEWRAAAYCSKATKKSQELLMLQENILRSLREWRC